MPYHVYVNISYILLVILGRCNMTSSERRERLLLLLAQSGFSSINMLAEKLGVSTMTIRRDLRYLEDNGQVNKIYGGGKIVSENVEPQFHIKRLLNRVEKSLIANAARNLVKPNMTIGISAGTTTWMLAKGLKGFHDLTFVTNSTNVATELQKHGYEDIILTGGTFRTPSDALVGPIGESTARILHTDLLFLGIHGISVKRGISTPNLLEATMNRILIEQSSKVCLLFDHTKWGIESLAQIAPLEYIHMIITDNHPDYLHELDSVRRMGIDVMRIDE